MFWEVKKVQVHKISSHNEEEGLAYIFKNSWDEDEDQNEDRNVSRAALSADKVSRNNSSFVMLGALCSTNA